MKHLNGRPEQNSAGVEGTRILPSPESARLDLNEL